MTCEKFSEPTPRTGVVAHFGENNVVLLTKNRIRRPRTVISRVDAPALLSAKIVSYVCLELLRRRQSSDPIKFFGVLLQVVLSGGGINKVWNLALRELGDKPVGCRNRRCDQQEERKRPQTGLNQDRLPNQ